MLRIFLILNSFVVVLIGLSEETYRVKFLGFQQEEAILLLVSICFLVWVLEITSWLDIEHRLAGVLKSLGLMVISPFTVLF